MVFNLSFLVFLVLQLRICPKCGAEIKSKTAFFCYACGEELEAPKFAVSPEPQKSPPLQKEISFAVPYFFILFAKLGGLFLLILVLGAGIGVGISHFRGRLAKTPPSTPNRAIVEENFPGLAPALPGKGNLPELTPATVSLYLEGTKPEVVLPKIFEESFGEELENQVGLNLTEAASFLEEQFALFERQETTAGSEIAFVAKARDTDFVAQQLEKLPSESSVSAVLIENFLVVSNSRGLTEEVERSLRKLTLSLALKTEFAESRRHLPEEGKLLLFFASRDEAWREKSSLKRVYDWIPGDLSGNGFVFVEEKGKTLVVGEE